MKIKTDKPQHAFEPRSITFTFETQEELDAMFSLFNYSAVADVHPSFENVWKELRRLSDKMMSDSAMDKILRHGCNRMDIVELAKKYTKP